MGDNISMSIDPKIKNRHDSLRSRSEAGRLISMFSLATLDMENVDIVSIATSPLSLN